MPGLPLAFASPMILAALLLLPAIWWLLRLTPPRPQTEPFPPMAILARLIAKDESPAKSPWWLTLLRLAMAASVIVAMAGPVFKPRDARLAGQGPVALIIDNGWASAPEWETRREAAQRVLDDAEAANRPVIIIETAGPKSAHFLPVDAASARARLAGLDPMPLKPSHQQAAIDLRRVLEQAKPGSVIFLSDGLARQGTGELALAISNSGGQPGVVTARTDAIVALDSVQNEPDAMTGTLLRVESQSQQKLTVEALDLKGLPIAQKSVLFEAGLGVARFRFEEPAELRNQIARLSVVEVKSAGAVQLLDDRYRRRIIGLISGESAESSQPLLSPLNYISKALAPFSDVRENRNANIAQAVPELIGQNVSAIVLADVGNLPELAQQKLGEWIDQGGMLIRFAGPRLAAAADDPLLPVKLRQGDRDLGGALSWDTPKLVAPFEKDSPFFGLEAPSGVAVRRQVLALQEIDLEQKTWAVLEDGTPLVTAEKRGSGWLVLFHVSSDAAWSNLPISGTFVEMLRRIANQSHSNGAQTGANQDITLAPLNILNGKGELLPPDASVKPLVLSQSKLPVASAANPPGYYGTEDGFVSINLFHGGETLTRLDPAIFAPVVKFSAYSRDGAIDLQPWLVALAALLLLLDCLAVLWIAGTLRGMGWQRAAAAGALIGAMVMHLAGSSGAIAQDKELAAALTTRLAYVITGDKEVDATSLAGLAGLTRFLAGRTALEPGEPVGIDLASDELAFFPMIYWPISLNAPVPDAAAMARADAFMKQGGTILFDTRDQGGGAYGGTAASPEAQRLQLVISSLDIPRLEPVPPDHVLTKSFYLLSGFVGRYADGELWIEASSEAAGDEADRPARAGDGVSTIMITSNDLAAAWAIDADGQPVFPTIPADLGQREMSFRAGVNIMMYAMTGNYKADQVHIPALLERLGQ